VKWARRRPAAAALVALSIVAAVSAAAAGLWFTAKLRDERDRAEAEKRLAQTTLAESFTASGLMAAERGDPAQAALWFANALGQAPDNPRQARANRQRFALWTRELPVPVRAMTAGETGEIVHFLPHPGGRYLLIERAGSGWRLWDLAAERPLPLPHLAGQLTAAVWSPDGRQLALGTDRGQCRLWSFPRLGPLHTLERGESVSELAFSADGRHLALGGRSVRLWDVQHQRFRTPAFDLPGTVTGLAFDPAGRRLAVACSDHKAWVFRLPEDSQPGPLRPAFDPVRNAPLAYSVRSHLVPVWVDGGGELLTYGGGSDLLRWDAMTGAKIGLLKTEVKGVDGVTVSPDGRRVAVYGWKEGGKGGARIYEAATGEAVGRPLEHANRVGCAAFSLDGHRLLTGGCDRVVRQWSVPAGQQVGPPLPHTGEVWGLAPVPGGLQTSSGRGEGLTRLWRLPNVRPPGIAFPVPDSGRCDRTLLSRDGKYVVARPGPKTARVLERATSKPAGPLLSVGEDFRSCAFAAGGHRLLLLTPAALQGWDWRTGKPAFAPLPLPAEAFSVTVSPDGSRAVVLCAAQGLMVDAARGEVLFRVAPEVPAKLPWYHPRARFSPDGRVFVTYCWPTVTIWDAVTGARRGQPLRHEALITFDACYSADGRLLATGADNYAYFWRPGTDQPPARLKHPAWVSGVGFSADGRYVVTACRDGEVRVWDWKARRLAGPALTHGQEVRAAVFLPGDATVFTASLDGTARIWDVATGKPLTPALPLPDGGERAELTPDGRSVVVDVLKGSAMVFDLGSLLETGIDGLDAAALRRLGEVNAAQAIQRGGVVNLTPEKWLDRWREFRRAWPRWHVPPGGPRRPDGP
jgi:WD40 repeat protein